MPLGSREYVAELIGAFALVFYGSMSVTVFAQVLALNSPAGGLLGIALAHGLILMVMVYAIGPISGCHINPAVTVAVMAQRKIGVTDGIAYIIFQSLGAGFAGLLHSFILPGARQYGFGGVFPTLTIGGSDLTATLIEAVLTFFLVLVIFQVAVSREASPGVSGVAIGMTLTAGILIGGPLTGGALNPVRALGPAIASGFFDHQWVYWVGPILGGLVASYVFAYLQRKE